MPVRTTGQLKKVAGDAFIYAEAMFYTGKDSKDV
jgi:hypothetical protein